MNNVVTDVQRSYRKGGLVRAGLDLIKMVGSSGGRVGSLLANAAQVAAQEHHFGKQYPLPLRKRLWAWRHGFSSRDYVLLELDDPETDPADYLSYVQQINTVHPAANPGYADVFSNKVLFALATNPHLDCVPTVFGTIDHHIFNAIGDGTGAHLSVVDLIDAQGDVILKPITGTQGRGVYHVAAEESAYRWNGEHIDEEELQFRLADLSGYMVCEFVEQAGYAASIAPSSANTIRIITLVDRTKREAIVVSAIHRFGGETDQPTDNWSAGGVAAPVDIVTGRMGRVHRYAPPQGLERFDRHPETNAQVAYETVPQWDRVIETVQHAAMLHQECPYVGWDVVVTDDGPVILEGNTTPHLALQQMGDAPGLLEDERVREFFER